MSGIEGKSNPALRAALNIPPRCDPSKHRDMIEEIAKAHPHSIVYVELPELSTCAPYALGLWNDPTYEAIRLYFWPQLFAGRDFMEWAIENRFAEIAEPRVGCLAMYFTGTTWQHCGVVSADGRVVSQWNNCPVYSHALFEIPAEYGDVVRYFEKPAAESALGWFTEYAEQRGVSAAEIEEAVAKK